jgi:hypothetical protein
MQYIYKIATLNINGMTSKTKIKMLEELLCQQFNDIALLKEVTFQRLNTIRRYNTYTKEGTEKKRDCLSSERRDKSNLLKKITNRQRNCGKTQ